MSSHHIISSNAAVAYFFSSGVAGVGACTWKERVDRFVSAWNYLAIINAMIFAGAVAALFSGVPPNPAVGQQAYNSSTCAVDCVVSEPNGVFSQLWGCTALFSLIAMYVCAAWTGALLRCMDTAAYNLLKESGMSFWTPVLACFGASYDLTFWPPFLSTCTMFLAFASLVYSFITVFGAHWQTCVTVLVIVVPSVVGGVVGLSHMRRMILVAFDGNAL